MAGKRQCLGVVTNPKAHHVGARCRRWAVNGSDFCAVHGGSSKNLLSDPASLEHRCTAKAHKTGDQCRNQAIRGGTVCRYHGGAAKHVQKKARERFNDLIDPMINITTRLTEDALAGRMSASDQMRLIAFIADRTGFNPGLTVEHEMRPWEVTMQHIWQELPGEIMRDVPEEMRAEIEASAQARQGAQREDILDAEVVEDEPTMPDNVTQFALRSRVRGAADPPNRT